MNEELQKLYEEYSNLGYSRNRAIMTMRNSGYDDASLDAMIELYSGKKKSQDSGSSESSSATGSMGPTSVGAQPQLQEDGASDSQIEEYNGVDVDVINGYRNATNNNIPEFLIPGGPSTDPANVSIDLPTAEVAAPEIFINVKGFLNGNKDPLFGPLLSLSQRTSFNSWAKQTIQENSMGWSNDKWVDSPDLSYNMLEVVEDMALESIFPDEILKQMDEGKSIRDLVKDNFPIMSTIDMMDQTLGDHPLPTKYGTARSLERKVKEKAQDFYEQFNVSFASNFIDQITNADYTERDENGVLTDKAKTNLSVLETAVLKEYGFPLDLTGDKILGENKGFFDYVWKRGQKGAIAAGNGIVNAIDALGVWGIGLDDEVDHDKNYGYVGPNGEELLTGRQYRKRWNEWTQQLGEERMNTLNEEMTQYIGDYRDAVKDRDFGRAATMMFGATAEGWPYLVPMLFTRRLGALPAATISASFGLSTEASAIRNDFTFDDFVKDGKVYSYYEASEIAGTKDIEELKQQFEVKENDLSRVGYLSQRFFGDVGQAYISIKTLKGLNIPQTKSWLAGYSKGLGVAMTENALAVTAATLNAELARNNFTGREEEFYDMVNTSVWTALEHSGTSFLLYNLGYGYRAAERSSSNNNTLTSLIHPDGKNIMQSVREAEARLAKTATHRNRLEALAVANNLRDRRNIMYRQNEQYLQFLRGQDKKNNTTLFAETVDILNYIDYWKYRYNLTNDPNLRMQYGKGTPESPGNIAKALQRLTDIWNTNSKDFYSSIGAGRGVVEREIQRSITGEDPRNIPELLLEAEHMPRPTPGDPVPVGDIVENNIRVEADKAARRAPEWMLKNLEDSEPSNIDRARLEEILNSEDFAILTGEFPPLRKYTEADNAAALDRAREWLKSEGLKFHEVTGRFDENGERSLLVESMTEAQAMKFLEVFEQHSAVRPRGIVKNNGDYANQDGLEWTFKEGVTEKDGGKEDGMSAIKLSDGSTVQFRRGLDKFIRANGDEFDGGGFWGMTDEQVAAQEAPPATVPDTYKDNRLKTVVHSARNAGSRALDWALAIRFGSYKDANGKKIKLNDKDVIETYKSLTRVKGAVDEVTQGDMYNYGAVYTLTGKKGIEGSVFSKLLRGEMSVDDPGLPALTADEKASIQSLRRNVDSLSDRLIEVLKARPSPRDKNGNITEEGKILLNLIETIQNNKGSYLTRSWEIFGDGGKRLDLLLKKREEMPKEIREVYDAAVRFQAQQMDYKLLQENPLAAEEAINSYLKDLAASKDKFGNVNVLAVVNNNILKHKNNAIPMPFQRLLGIIDDPTYEYFATISKLRSYTTNYEWQMSMAEALVESGLGTFNVSEGTRSPLGLYSKMNETAQPHEPLYGLMIPKELQATFNMLDPLRTWESMVGKTGGGALNLMTQLSAFAKIGHTVLAPTSTVRNFWSGNFLQIAAGHHWLMNPTKSLDAIRMAWPTKRMLGKAQGLNKKGWMTERDKLVRGGVLGESVNATELMRNFQDLIGQDYSKQFASGNIPWEIAQRFYAFGDDFYKAMGYYQERQMLVERGMLLEDAEILAMTRIRDMYPTYSNISRGARELRRAPFVAPFPSFPYEVVRTTKNIIKTAAQDMAAGRKDMAVQRILGLLTSMFLIDGAHEASMDYWNFDDEDDEAFRMLGPEWNANAKLMYLGKDKETGNAEFIDLSYLFPEEVIMKPIRAILGGDPNSDGYFDDVMSMLDEGLGPYVGSDMFGSTVLELLKNEDENGRKIIDTYDNEYAIEAIMRDEKIAGDALQHVFDSYAPGFLKGNMIDFLRASEMVDKDNPWYELQYEFQKRYPKTTRYREYTFSSAFAQLAGLKSSETSLDVSAEYKFKDLSADMYAMENDHERRILSTKFETPESEIYEVSNRLITRHTEMSKRAIQVSNMVKKVYSDLDEYEIEDRIMSYLTKGGFSKQAAADIYEGRIPDLQGFTLSNVEKYIQPVLDDRTITEEEKLAAEDVLMKNADAYNDIIMRWNDNKNDDFERQQED